MDARLQHLADGSRARTAEELATVFLALGDLSAEEAAARSDGAGAAWVEELAEAGRLVPVDLAGERRYVLAEQAAAYGMAFEAAVGETSRAGGVTGQAASEEERDEARRAILRRTLSTHGPLERADLLARYPWGGEWLDAALEALVENGEAVRGQITPGPAEAAGPTIEYCDRRNLERIHRQTLALLRKEVEPVSIYDYADFLARWQHLHPAERLSGPGALARCLQQLRGVPAPGAVWERDVLPLRLEAYDPGELEEMCGRGEVVWAGSGGRDPRRARVRFFFRGEGGLFLADEPEEAGDLSPAAAAVLDFLRSEGASFFADLQEGVELEEGTGVEALGGALVELVMAGLVTNDTLPALRQVLAWGGEAEGPQRKPLSSLEAELTAWRREREAERPRARGVEGGLRRPSRDRLSAARRTVGRRLEGTAPPQWPGRWSLVHRIGVWGREVPYEERIGRQARQLLQCYGVVTRHSLEALRAEAGDAWDWRALYAQFQLMEMRGEVRRGYFVEGLPGVQFALPEAVERLREWSQAGAPGEVEQRREWSQPGVPGAPGTEMPVLLNACDPANLFGPALPGAEEEENDPARFSRIPANYLVTLRGRPALLLEAGGERVTALEGLPRETVRRALALAVGQAGAGRRLTVAEWNGQPVLDSPGGPLLEEAGFFREALVYVRESG